MREEEEEEEGKELERPRGRQVVSGFFTVRPRRNKTKKKEKGKKNEAYVRARTATQLT